MKNKRGSHISFIISFVLFISFLIFFIGIIKPFEKIETGKGTLLKHLENEIINEVSAEVMVVSAMKKGGGSKSCSDIKDLIDNKKNILLEDDMGLIKIYVSSNLQSSLTEFACDVQNKYEIGLIKTEKYILKSKIENLKNRYDNGDDLKAEFEIPEVNDFEFSFLNINKEVIIETTPKETPPTEVLAELIPVIYLDEDNAKIKNGYIKVILW